MSEHSLGEIQHPSLTAQRLQEMRTKIDSRLEELFKQPLQETRLSCAIRHGLLSPGKRFRPIITLLACEQTGGKINDLQLMSSSAKAQDY